MCSKLDLAPVSTLPHLRRNECITLKEFENFDKVNFLSESEYINEELH